MKAWRKEAAALKKFAIAAGKHERGNRYGKALRDSRKMPAQRLGLVSPLFVALLDRFGRAWFADMVAGLEARGLTATGRASSSELPEAHQLPRD